MKFFNLFVIAALLAVTISCTLDKTDFEAETSTEVTEHYEFKEAVMLQTGNYKIKIEALNGTFYKGYNEIRLSVFNRQDQPVNNVTTVNLLPILKNSDGDKNSCPHSYDLVYDSEGNYFVGYIVFAQEGNPMENWQLNLNFTINNQTYDAVQTVSVEKQTNMNLNMTSFTGNDGEQYFIALVGPQKPKVAENELIAGIYKYNQPTDSSEDLSDHERFSYTVLNDYKLLLDPRMPEPSMGNHSSPNNKDLEQREKGGLYYGVVNYTMTGNWTLNFILLNENGEVIKGTEVPTDFTPGIEGAKSELYIDTLF